MGCCYACKRVEIKEGRAAVLWRDGKATLIEGPRVIRAGCHGSIEFVRRYYATESQYLAITYDDGHTEHILGPKSVFEDPVKHRSIEVKPLMVLEAGEAMIVMRRGTDSSVVAAASSPSEEGEGEGKEGKEKSKSKSKGKNKSSSSSKDSRVIIRGPCYHMPTPDETQHEFIWTGSDPSCPNRKTAGMLRFTTLRLTPDQMYISVPEARTSDDALLSVNLLVFYEISDLERMLDRTHDPIADMMNAATSDIVAFCAGFSYETFLEKTDTLNNIEAYPQLISRAKTIGFEVTKVVYRGYTASTELQSMQDHALRDRTKLRIDLESEEQSQRLADLRLAKEHDRQKKTQEMQREAVEHDNAVLRMQNEEKLYEEKQIHDAKLAQEASENAHRLDYYKQLKELGVDINAYLLANGTRPEKLIQIAEGTSAKVHVHASDN